jgi:hypothetical protein
MRSAEMKGFCAAKGVIMQTDLNVQSHLSKSSLIVFCKLQGILLHEFGDLILCVCDQKRARFGAEFERAGDVRLAL